MALRRRGAGTTLDAWPGYVDALSTLLMVITFVLLVFVLAQAFLSVKLSSKDTELQTLDRQIAQLTDMLSLERGRTAQLTLAVSGLNQAANDAQARRDALRRALTAAEARLSGADAATRAAAGREAVLTAELSDARTDQQSAAARASQASTISEQAEIAALNAQLTQLRLQMTAVSNALDLTKASDTGKAAEIAELTKRLNVALADKVEELQRYRSEFFGKLRAVLKDVPGIQIVGDRFVFQSEVLFPVDGASLSSPGEAQLKKLAGTLLQIAKQIPAGLPWIMRVDGHADPQPVGLKGHYQSNWELSAERAINVVRFLVAQGVPADHLAATAFGDTQPLVSGTSEADYARDRRIELRLTDR